MTLPSGESATGGIVRLTDFEVTIYDAATRQMRSWLRNGDTPKLKTFAEGLIPTVTAHLNLAKGLK